MRHLLLVAILLFVVEVTGAEFMNAERKCWEKSGCTEPTSFDRSDADKVNCYAYEHDCKGAEVKFAFVTIQSVESGTTTARATSTVCSTTRCSFVTAACVVARASGCIIASEISETPDAMRQNEEACCQAYR